MAQEQRGPRQQRTTQDRPDRDAERNRDWADDAAEARTADDPRATAPRDAGGRPSQGRPL